MNQKPLTAMELAITRMIVDRAGRRRESLAGISRVTGVRLSELVKLARLAGVRYKHRHQTPATIARAIALVRDKGLTVRQAAATVGMSKTAVHRFVLKRRQKAVDAAGQVKFESSASGAPKPKSWRCAVHGPVTVWPCVACMALSAKRR